MRICSSQSKYINIATNILFVRIEYVFLHERCSRLERDNGRVCTPSVDLVYLFFFSTISCHTHARTGPQASGTNYNNLSNCWDKQCRRTTIIAVSVARNNWKLNGRVLVEHRAIYASFGYVKSLQKSFYKICGADLTISNWIQCFCAAFNWDWITFDCISAISVNCGVVRSLIGEDFDSRFGFSSLFLLVVVALMWLPPILTHGIYVSNWSRVPWRNSRKEMI